jgi:hypothetical protein
MTYTQPYETNVINKESLLHKEKIDTKKKFFN